VDQCRALNERFTHPGGLGKDLDAITAEVPGDIHTESRGSGMSDTVAIGRANNVGAGRGVCVLSKTADNLELPEVSRQSKVRKNFAPRVHRGDAMESAKSVNGVPLSGRKTHYQFADHLRNFLRNLFNRRNSHLELTSEDKEWLRAIDRAFRN
jgi:hypothetical protein